MGAAPVSFKEAKRHRLEELTESLQPLLRGNPLGQLFESIFHVMSHCLLISYSIYDLAVITNTEIPVRQTESVLEVALALAFCCSSPLVLFFLVAPAPPAALAPSFLLTSPFASPTTSPGLSFLGSPLSPSPAALAPAFLTSPPASPGKSSRKDIPLAPSASLALDLAEYAAQLCARPFQSGSSSRVCSELSQQCYMGNIRLQNILRHRRNHKHTDF